MTGLARAGKTMFLTSVAANLLALGQGSPVLPALAARLGGQVGVRIADAGTSAIPRFDYAAKLAALTADPPGWPAPTNATSLLALELTLPRTGFIAALPPQRLRLELLDYPGEWLLDLPLLRTSYADWSAATLRRLEPHAEASAFLAFQSALPAGPVDDEALAAAGHRLYVQALQRLKETGLALLQPGRFLMPPPGDAPPWTQFFPHHATTGLLARRYGQYVEAVQKDLSDPLFGQVDRLVVLVDLLTALHRGQEPFEDARAALTEAAAALRWRRTLLETIGSLAQLRAPPRTIARVAFAATKADHVGRQQRDNLAALLRRVVAPPARGTIEPTAPTTSAYFAIASVLCTADDTMTLDGRAVSAVRGLPSGERIAARSYPGEVPSSPPDAGFWAAPFYALPDFQPLRPPEAGRGGVPNLALDALLLSLLDDAL